MQETVVKYENCDDIYVGATEMSANYGAPAIKRSYSAVSAENDNYHPVGCQITAQIRAQYNNLYAPQQTQSNRLGTAAPIKRTRRGESTVLFSPPFFELQDYNSVTPGAVITARCLSCHVVLRGHKNVSSNFIKHMKRVHPDVYKSYENIKLLKYRRCTKDDTAANACNNSNNADNDQPYFDANAFLQNINALTTSIDEEHNSEATDHSGATPSNSTEDIETPESSTESQQRLPTLRVIADDKIMGKETTNMCRQVDLSNKTLDMMSNMLDEKLKAFVTKTQFNETTQIISNLVERQTPDTENSNSECNIPNNKPLEMQVNALQQECQQLRASMRQVQQSKRQLHQELQAMDKVLHRRKIVVRNLKLEDGEKPQDAVSKMFRERLQLPNIGLLKVTNITINRPQQNNNQRQHLLVELRNESDASAIFKNCFKLKNSGIFIESDLSHFARKRKDKLLVLRKELLRRKAELRVIVRDTQMFVGGRQFYWDEVDGLCIHGSNQAESDLNAADCLKAAIGIDLSEFINVLKNYDIQLR